MKVKFQYTPNGHRNQTWAITEDSKIYQIDRRYKTVKSAHTDDCPAWNRGECNCGVMDGIDTDDLIKQALENGKFGPEPVETKVKEVDAMTMLVEAPKATPRVHGVNGWCNRCHSYCYSDCQS